MTKQITTIIRCDNPNCDHSVEMFRNIYPSGWKRVAQNTSILWTSDITITLKSSKDFCSIECVRDYILSQLDKKDLQRVLENVYNMPSSADVEVSSL